jgi:MFS family permease
MFISIVIAGVILDRGKALDAEKWGFVAILCLAVAGRATSVYALTRHFEVPYSQDSDAYFSFWQFVRRAPNSNFAHFVFLISLMNFSVQMAAPFFVVYMMRDLGFSYLEFMIAQGVFIATQFFAMRRWGAFADRFGNRAVIYISGAIVTFLPLLWFFSTSFAYIIVIQVFAGLAWGGWFLGSANFIFDAVTPPKRARCAAYMNFFHSTGFFFGTLLGAWLSLRAPRVIQTGAMTITLLSPLQFIFLCSSGLRLLVLLVFAPSIREVRAVDRAAPREMFTFLAHIKPLSGVRFLPFTGHGKNENENENQ